MAILKKTSTRKNVLILIETSRAYGRDLIAGITQFASEKKGWNLFLSDQITASRNTRWLKEWEAFAEEFYTQMALMPVSNG